MLTGATYQSGHYPRKKVVFIVNVFLGKVAVISGGLTAQIPFLCVFCIVLTSTEIKLIGSLLYGVVYRLPFFMCLESLC